MNPWRIAGFTLAVSAVVGHVTVGIVVGCLIEILFIKE